VFVVMLENENAATTFAGQPPSPYLAQTLPAQGAMVPNYYGIGHSSLDNYIALISGQAPNEKTQLDCPLFSDFLLQQPGLDAHGQLLGLGCVYPNTVKALPDQLEAAHFTWKGYMEDMGKDPRRERATCGHPAVGAPDETLIATAADKYAAKHDPFVYFHTIIDDQARCDTHVVNVNGLPKDLQSAATTPNYVFITPNLCHDGHDGGHGNTCIDGEPGGLSSADRFLAALVPQIMSSPAFRRDGLLIITFDESDVEDEYLAASHAIRVTGGDAAACCDEQPGPNLPAYQADAGIARTTINGPGLIGPGGGRIGAVLLSPFIRPGTVSQLPYNHYALLRSVEDIFGLAHLGFAGQAGLKPFGADVFTQPNGNAR
jgi:hypothetical protein